MELKKHKSELQIQNELGLEIGKTILIKSSESGLSREGKPFRIVGLKMNEGEYAEHRPYIISISPRWHNVDEYYEDDLDPNFENIEIGENEVSGGYKWAFVDESYDTIQSNVDAIMANNFDYTPYLEDQRQTTELMSFNKETYVALHDSIEKKRLILQNSIDRAKMELEERLEGLNMIVAEFAKKVAKLERIIFTIELYLGIEEDIHHIKQGKTSDDKIKLCQAMLYMDEELGDPTDGGLEIADLDKFDEWLLKENQYHKVFNYELIAPFEKCVRILRVRREKKRRDYISNPFVRSMLAQEDFETYLLIRNGENIYRIASKLNFGEKLFPNPDELHNLYKEEVESGRSRRKEEAEETVKNRISVYQRNLIIMQGLVAVSYTHLTLPTICSV